MEGAAGSRWDGWNTPFLRQCWVTAGISVNMMTQGLVAGFTTVLLPQLRQSHSGMQVDEDTGSWIASVVGVALVPGALLTPALMGRWGRRGANVSSAALMTAGWVGVAAAGEGARGVAVLVAARAVQGLAMGISATSSSTSIGEYTSPGHRGVFLATVSLAIATGVLAVHTLGSLLGWRRAALACSSLAFVDLLALYHSPETPAWLASRGRYGDCRRVYRWLRGDRHDDELEDTIRANVAILTFKADRGESTTFGTKVQRRFRYVVSTFRKREFYKPLIIMLHLYVLNQWSGANLLAAYATDVVHEVVGPDASVVSLLITMGVQRIASNAAAIFVIGRVRRRRMLLATVGINVSALLATALYVFARSRRLLPFDHPLLGATLMHVHMFSIATGTVPLPIIIAGEIFPLQYRGVGSALSVLCLSANMFLCMKTAPALLARAGLAATYCLYGAVVSWCLLVAWLLLPETKDRTLQQIEDEFRGDHGAPSPAPHNAATPLQMRHVDRRCSSPILF